MNHALIISIEWRKSNRKAFHGHNKTKRTLLFCCSIVNFNHKVVCDHLIGRYGTLRRHLVLVGELRDGHGKNFGALEIW